MSMYVMAIEIAHINIAVSQSIRITDIDNNNDDDGNDDDAIIMIVVI